MMAIVMFAMKEYQRLGSYLIKIVFCSAAYYGIEKRKNWVVPVVLLLSAWGLINFFFYIFEPSRSQNSQIIYYITSGIGVTFLIFYIYSIFIFSKNKTRIFFNETGKILF
jgi:hypothetical protein